MDEAERCEQIAYVAGGRILARGTARSIIEATGLAMWIAEGRGLAELRASVSHRPGVDLVAPFGARLHIIGRDRAALEHALAPFRSQSGLSIGESAPTLEDVFLELQRRSADTLPADAAP
jgi:ABC-2 type transport system ATP-binding protein